MLHMQHAQLALILMQSPEKPDLEFPTETREHQLQLERVRESLLRRPELRTADERGI